MMRKNFPAYNTGYRGGHSDGWCFHVDFWNDKEDYDDVLSEIKKFLIEEGYEDVPLPKNAERLWRDYIVKEGVGEFGNFVWHPIMITGTPYKECGLALYIYNENHPEHQELWNDQCKRQ